MKTFDEFLTENTDPGAIWDSATNPQRKTAMYNAGLIFSSGKLAGKPMYKLNVKWAEIKDDEYHQDKQMLLKVTSWLTKK
jgi:hypothetical protein